MDVSIRPPLGEPERRAVIEALEREGLDAEAPPGSYASAWRAAALAEATESAGEAEDYTLSPRRTRGATRA